MSLLSYSYCITGISKPADTEFINLKLIIRGGFGRSPFSYCTGLTTLDLDGSNGNLGSMGNTMFYGCTGLTSVTVKNVDAIPVQMFNGCTELTTVNLENIDSVGQQAFLSCTKLDSVDLKRVTTIGEMAFLGASMKTVTMEDVNTIGKNAFASCKALETVTMTGETDTIGQYAFYNCTGLKTVTMGTVNTIDQYAFWNCSALETIDSLKNVTNRIGGFAFYGCSSLTGLTVEDMTKMGYNGSVEMMERILAILAGKFQLDNPNQITELTPDASGWAASGVGKSTNWNQYDNGTQLVEQVRWNNTANSVRAEVQVDAYYTAEKQMDYIFVADLSASMAQLGNPEDDNARFYDMQSKLLDMTGKLLGTDGYDCQVAIVTFGGEHQNKATVNASGFLTNASAAKDYINTLEPLNENTDYGLGLQEALKLAAANKQEGRNTVVVFLSDGAPNRATSGDMDGTKAAAEIKALDVPIYGVLHSPTAAQYDKALKVMQAVCGENTVYESTDTESFGRAMNSAFFAASAPGTVTIPVNYSDFENVQITVSEGGGEAHYDAATHSIVWTVGMPFTRHTLSYTITLRDELANRVGTYTYNVNGGDAKFGESGATVRLETVRLSRTVSGGGGGGGGGTGGGGGGGTVSIEDPEVPLAGNIQLNRDDHFAYVSGYADNTVRPGNNITREEVASIFYRLLTDTSRAIYETDTNDFSDVAGDRWSNRAISTLTNAGIISGYPDGTFRPDQTITRAEFAAIAARFDMITENLENPFSDTAGHWAENLISFAASKSWVSGYSDGTFLPQKAITRAEAMTLVNNVLNRKVDKEGLLPGAKQWSDNPEGTWYYYEVLEATNSHDYTRDEGATAEQWTALK